MANGIDNGEAAGMARPKTLTFRRVFAGFSSQKALAKGARFAILWWHQCNAN
jgi:hypothetical protein